MCKGYLKLTLSTFATIQCSTLDVQLFLIEGASSVTMKNIIFQNCSASALGAVVQVKSTPVVTFSNVKVTCKYVMDSFLLQFFNVKPSDSFVFILGNSNVLFDQVEAVGYVKLCL